MTCVSKTVRTTCPYCGVGCGVLAEVASNGAVAVRGDPEHPANFGRLCSKGSALAETLSLEDRLLEPEIGGVATDWDTALDRVAETFSAAIAEHGPDSVAFYVSGQLLTEDYYVANKLMKGFVGTANIDTNSRLCMSSSVAGHIRAFGTDTVPGTYTDLEQADLVVLVGSNLAWCHPVLYQRLMAAREQRGTTLVVIDPRRTPTAEAADLHLAIDPDGDVALFNGLLRHLAETALDDVFVADHTSGLDAALASAGALDLAAVLRTTGLSAADLGRFYNLFAGTERVVTVYSQGVNQSVAGTDKVNAIINCHLATGRIGRPGMGPFSVTGQPNAMGGREVGGLASMLAAHLDIADPSHRDLVQGFWQAPRIAQKPGLKAVELFRAVGDGRIKALWIMGTNPVVSMPEADAVEAALRACPFVVCSDVIRRTDTTCTAYVLLPAAAWGEKDGTVTNSERRISRQRPFLDPPGQGQPDWWIVSQVAARMGFAKDFAYDHAGAIFDEHARLCVLANAGQRDLDLSGVESLDRAAYDALPPVQWPVPRGAAPEERRFFADGRFFTPDGRARFVPVTAPFKTTTDPAFPFVLNTGRIRDHWHTMTRTGKSARLSAHLTEPFVALNARDADVLGIRAGELVEVSGQTGARFVGRAQIGTEQRRDAVFVPMHWTDQFSSTGRIDALVPNRTDPVSGQPASKNVPVQIRPFRAAWYGYAVVSTRPGAVAADYWAFARIAGGWQGEFAGAARIEDVRAFAQDCLGAERDEVRLVSYEDAASSQYRMAAFEGDRLIGALFVAPKPLGIARAHLAHALSKATTKDGLRLLAGRPGAGRPDVGETICACFQVGINQIVAALTHRECKSVTEIGAALKAGTNCGSCRPDIQRLVLQHA